MKRALSIAAVSVVAAAFVTSLYAQTSTGKNAATDSHKAHSASPDKKPVVERAPAGTPKGKQHRFTGTVVAVDTRLKTMVVKGKNEQMTFEVGKAQVKGGVREEDRVTVTYAKKSGNLIASSVVKSGEEKTGKKQMKPGAQPVQPASAKK